jgi:CheY-like chemotaxis protein
MNYTILIADDEKEIRELLKLYLENEQYQVVEAEDGQQALDILRREKIYELPGYHLLDIVPLNLRKPF